MYQALYRKYRPKNLDEVWGQDTIVTIIKNSITNNKINHAYLFAGPRGTGKTSIAKIFANMVNCDNLQNGKLCGKCVNCTQTNNSDIIEIDAASNNGVDEIRELRNKVNLVPSYGKYKIYIIDEVHMLTTGAFNALLKTLEEPPSHIIFVLATTDPHKIPETILSRCQRLDFKKISNNNIVNRLKQITEAEKIEIDEDALYEIADLSDGGMRDSIGMLDQALAYSESKITIQDIHDINGTVTEQDLQEIITLIYQKDLNQLLTKIDFYNDRGKNFVKFTEELVKFLRNILLYNQASDYFKTTTNKITIYKNLKAKFETSTILSYIKILNDCKSEMYLTNNPKLLLELSLIQMIVNSNKEIEIKEQNNETKEILKEKQSILNEKQEKHQATEQKNEPEKQQEAVTKQIVNKATENKILNTDLMLKIKNIRIDNTLANFNKAATKKIINKLDFLNSYLLDPDVGKYASIILDGTLKAASDKNLIFVFPNNNTTKIFNENLVEIEETLLKALDNKYKAIATNQSEWDKIKNEFNSKKRKFIYHEEEFKLKDLYTKNHTNNGLSDFEDIIEYQ